MKNSLKTTENWQFKKENLTFKHHNFIFHHSDFNFLLFWHFFIESKEKNLFGDTKNPVEHLNLYQLLSLFSSFSILNQELPPEEKRGRNGQKNLEFV